MLTKWLWVALNFTKGYAMGKLGGLGGLKNITGRARNIFSGKSSMDRLLGDSTGQAGRNLMTPSKRINPIKSIVGKTGMRDGPVNASNSSTIIRNRF